MMQKQFTPSVLERLEQILKTLAEIVRYETAVCGDDYHDAIDYDKLKDLVDAKIKEIKENHEFDHHCDCEKCEEYARQKAEDDAVDRHIENEREARSERTQQIRDAHD